MEQLIRFDEIDTCGNPFLNKSWRHPCASIIYVSLPHHDWRDCKHISSQEWSCLRQDLAARPYVCHARLFLRGFCLLRNKYKCMFQLLRKMTCVTCRLSLTSRQLPRAMETLNIVVTCCFGPTTFSYLFRIVVSWSVLDSTRNVQSILRVVRRRNSDIGGALRRGQHSLIKACWTCPNSFLDHRSSVFLQTVTWPIVVRCFSLATSASNGYEINSINHEYLQQKLSSVNLMSRTSPVDISVIELNWHTTLFQKSVFVHPSLSQTKTKRNCF